MASNRRSALFCAALCFFLALQSCAGQLDPQQQQQQQQQQQRPQHTLQEGQECRIERLTALERSRRVESEAGVIEYWAENDQKFQCAGVAALRLVIERRGLLLPTFSNALMLVYIHQGSGITGEIIPGCPESFQSFSQTRRGRGEQRFNRDQHQKIRYFRQGDISPCPPELHIGATTMARLLLSPTLSLALAATPTNSITTSE